VRRGGQHRLAPPRAARRGAAPAGDRRPLPTSIPRTWSGGGMLEMWIRDRWLRGEPPADGRRVGRRRSRAGAHPLPRAGAPADRSTTHQRILANMRPTAAAPSRARSAARAAAAPRRAGAVRLAPAGRPAGRVCVPNRSNNPVLAAVAPAAAAPPVAALPFPRGDRWEVRMEERRGGRSGVGAGRRLEVVAGGNAREGAGSRAPRPTPAPSRFTSLAALASQPPTASPASRT